MDEMKSVEEIWADVRSAADQCPEWIRAHVLEASEEAARRYRVYLARLDHDLERS